jgi:hypothetical protein
MQSLKTASRMSTSNENLILLNIVQGTLNTLVDSLQLVNSITLEYIIETVIKITMLSVSMILIIKGLSQQDKIITCTLFAAWPNITAAVCGFAQGVEKFKEANPCHVDIIKEVTAWQQVPIAAFDIFVQSVHYYVLLFVTNIPCVTSSSGLRPQGLLLGNLTSA